MQENFSNEMLPVILCMFEKQFQPECPEREKFTLQHSNTVQFNA